MDHFEQFAVKFKDNYSHRFANFLNLSVFSIWLITRPAQQASPSVFFFLLLI